MPCVCVRVMPMSIFGILNHVESISRVTYMRKYGIFGKAAVPNLKIIQIQPYIVLPCKPAFVLPHILLKLSVSQQDPTKHATCDLVPQSR